MCDKQVRRSKDLILPKGNLQSVDQFHGDSLESEYGGVLAKKGL